MLDPGDRFRASPDDALVLRLDVAPDHEAADVERLWFDVKVGGRRLALLETTVQEIGLARRPNVGFTEGGGDQTFVLPLYIGESLRELIPASSEPLWLVLTEPRGYLPIVPWEDLLLPFVQAPVVRYAPDDIPALHYESSRHSVLCFCCDARDSEKEQRAIIDLYLSMIPQDLGENIVHVFADDFSRELLERMRQPAFIFHEPPAIAPIDSRENGSVEPMHPWLKWILSDMHDLSVAFVHFVCHGFFRSNEGGLSFIRPTATADVRMAVPAGVREMNDFLDRLGAWSVGFSSPPTNRSPAGLRCLQDQLAMLRSGPVLLHDMRRDYDRSGVMSGYRYYMSGVAPRSGALALYWNAHRVNPKPERREQLKNLTLAERVGGLSNERGDVPSWVASAQRTLEASLRGLGDAPITENGDRTAQIRAGVAAALAFAADTIEGIAQSTPRAESSEEPR